MARGRQFVTACVAIVALAGCSSSADDGAASTTAPASSAADPGSDSSEPEPASEASSGCEGEPLEAGRSTVAIDSGGTERAYIRYVPEGLEPAAPAPLVIDFTAYSPASMEESFSGFTKPDGDGVVLADEVGAVVVTPEPVNGEGLLTWNVDDTEGWTDDQQFVTDLLDDVEADACIDADRVLAMGFAIGAVMASTVACEQPERITVLATVSGLWEPPGCDPSEPTPVISFHGDDDHFLPFDGGVGDRIGGLSLSGATSAGLAAMAARPGAQESSQAWAERNGCGPDVEAAGPVDGVDELTWSGCDAPVQLEVVHGGSHTWPGSNGMADYEGLLGPVSQAIDANDVIWEFFTANS